MKNQTPERDDKKLAIKRLKIAELLRKLGSQGRLVIDLKDGSTVEVRNG